MVNVVGAAFALAGFLEGGAGSVSLGGISMQQFEIPERIPFGGEQRTKIHKLPGGGRVYDLMGDDEADITFTGYFYGPQASSRARQLDIMRVVGVPVTLNWLGFARQVIITKFQCATERAGYWLPYSVTCSVLSVVVPAQSTSLLGGLVSDAASALGITAAITAVQQTVQPILATANAAIAQVQAVLPVAAVLTGGSPAFLSIQSAVNSASGIVSGGLAATEGTMNGLRTATVAVGNLLGTKSAAQAISALQIGQGASQSLAGLTGQGAYLSRINANLAGASS